MKTLDVWTRRKELWDNLIVGSVALFAAIVTARDWFPVTMGVIAGLCLGSAIFYPIAKQAITDLQEHIRGRP